jgi:hypothetical protein
VGRDLVVVVLAEMSEVRTAKTASRSVLGVMNEFKFLAEVETQFVDEHDRLSLSLRLAETRVARSPNATSAPTASLLPSWALTGEIVSLFRLSKKL